MKNYLFILLFLFGLKLFGQDSVHYGKVSSENDIRFGDLHGKSISYSKNGKVTYIANYQNGNLNGLITWFDHKGRKSKEDEYKDGLLDGKSRSYYKNGRVMEEAEYLNDKAHGLYRMFFDDGALYQTGTYSADKKNGKWITYDGAGGILFTNYWDNGVKKPK